MYQKFKETYSFNHKGIIIWVKIDYRNNRIDIVEPKDRDCGQFRKKEFIFVGRGVEYMNGWVDILEAVSEAVKDAKKRYEKELAETSKFKEKKLIGLLMKKQNVSK